ncbi:MAG: T9SS type A sorting domain-containing protein [Owenweeksia sp.]
MKKLIFSFLSAIVVSGLSAQNFYYTSGPSINEAGLASGETTSIVEFQKNDKGSAVTFSWALLSADTIEQSSGATVSYGLCDNVTCYNFFTSGNFDMDPISGMNEYGLFKLQCFSVSGDLELKVKIRVWDQSNPGVEDTVSFVWRTDNFVSIDEQKVNKPKMKLYPNPVSNTLFITNNSRANMVKVFDIVGNEVRMKPIGPSARIDFTDLPAGIYLVELRNGESRIALEKIIKR